MRKLIATMIIIGGLAVSGFAATPAMTTPQANDAPSAGSTAGQQQDNQCTTCPASTQSGDPDAAQNYVEYGAGG